MARDRVEVAVVGSGPGGGVTASVLAEAGKDVLLIEEGASFPADSCRPFSIDELVQKYRNGGLTVAMARPNISYAEGRCVGGGGEINAGLYHRTPPAILDQWRSSHRVEGLAESDLEPHFEAVESALGVASAAGSLPPPSQKLAQGAERLGWASTEVPRSTIRTLVPRFLAAGGRLMPSTRVLRLSRRNGVWELAYLGGTVEAETVFVCGGAIQTPALLRRSGITRNVGSSLGMHVTVKLVARFADEVNSDRMGVPARQVKEFAPRLSLGCSVSTPAYLALALADSREHLGDVDRHWRFLTTYYAMVPCGRGTVRNVPFSRDPLVRYALQPQDLEDLSRGIRLLGRCLLAAGAVELYPGIRGWPPITSEADLERIPRELPRDRASLMSVHLFSSCPMGEDARRCAADSFGRVHGMRGLYVGDASLLCSAPTVNPQGSVMAIARRNALRFVGAA